MLAIVCVNLSFQRKSTHQLRSSNIDPKEMFKQPHTDTVEEKKNIQSNRPPSLDLPSPPFFVRDFSSYGQF